MNMTLIIYIGFAVIISAVIAGVLDYFSSRRNSKRTNQVMTRLSETELMKHVRVLESRIERCENKLYGTNNQVYTTPNKPIIEVVNATNINNQKKDRTQSSSRKKDKEKKNKEKKAEMTEMLQEKKPGFVRPENVEYTSLTVMDGKLVVASSSQVSYYRAWEIEGDIFFEFYSDRTAKAINNRSVIIEPFCDKDPESVPADKATSIETSLCGFLNKDYSINTKTTIKYK